MNKPVLFCFDGSEGSRTALRAAVEWLKPDGDAVVLTVWTPAAVQLARSRLAERRARERRAVPRRRQLRPSPRR